MDEQEVRTLVDQMIDPLLCAFYVSDWHVQVFYDHDIDSKMQITMQPEYRDARLVICPHVIADSDDFLDALVHEMCHMVHAEFETYRKAVATVVDDRAFDVLDVLWVMACEKTVAHLRRLIKHGLGLGDQDIITKGSRWTIEQKSSDD